MEIRQLEMFLAVMESGSVRRAAQQVFLTPGAVSMQLAHLAEELQTELFVRSHRQFLPTPAAMRLAEQARILLHNVRQIEQEFGSDPLLDSRPFRFATGTTSLIHSLARPLRVMRTRYPKTEIQVTVSATEEMVAGLLARRFDLAIISLPYPESGLAGLHIVPLFQEEMLVLRPAPRLVRERSVTAIKAAEMTGASFILYPKTSNMRTIIEGQFRDLGISPRVILEADDTEAIKALVGAGFGYSVLPEFALRGRPHFFHMCRVAGRRLIRTQALAMLKTDFPRPLTRSIAAFLQGALGKR
jgi:LysR family hydrogen peroxide-inducible transcriptional activator